MRGKLAYSAHARARKCGRMYTCIHESWANDDGDVRWHVRSILANSLNNFHFARIMLVRSTRTPPSYDTYR